MHQISRDTAAVRKHMADKGHFKILHDNTTLAEYADFYDYTTSYPEGCAPGLATNSIFSVSFL